MPDYYDEMGDAVFRAQFRTMEEAFRAAELEVRVEPFGERDVHYQYAPGRVLMRNDTDEFARAIAEAERLLPGARSVRRSEQNRLPATVSAVFFDGPGANERGLDVPGALDLLDEEIGAGLATPDHILSITGVSNCPGTEPDPIAAGDPYPVPSGDAGAGRDVRIGVPDSGFVRGLAHPWLAGVDGEPDPNVDVTTVPATLHAYAGHGTFIAGVARGAAPAADIWVSNHYRLGGANVESEVFADLIDMIDGRVRVDGELKDVGAFDIVSLSAGGHTRNDVPNLAGPEVAAALARNEKTLLLAAAGNNSSRRRFWPAAHPEVTGVGALGFDRQRRAWFSNFGAWVDVWALGEGLINAYPEGRYTYNEPPRKRYQLLFDQLARWSGTSFATPLVAGLVAAEMTRTGLGSREALASLVGQAVAVDGAGLAL